MKCKRCLSKRIVVDFDHPDLLICEDCGKRFPNTSNRSAMERIRKVSYSLNRVVEDFLNGDSLSSESDIILDTENYSNEISFLTKALKGDLKCQK